MSISLFNWRKKENSIARTNPNDWNPEGDQYAVVYRYKDTDRVVTLEQYREAFGELLIKKDTPLRFGNLVVRSGDITGYQRFYDRQHGIKIFAIGITHVVITRDSRTALQYEKMLDLILRPVDCITILNNAPK